MSTASPRSPSSGTTWSSLAKLNCLGGVAEIEGAVAAITLLCGPALYVRSRIRSVGVVGEDDNSPEAFLDRARAQFGRRHVGRRLRESAADIHGHVVLVRQVA